MTGVQLSAISCQWKSGISVEFGIAHIVLCWLFLAES